MYCHYIVSGLIVMLSTYLDAHFVLRITYTNIGPNIY